MFAKIATKLALKSWPWKWIGIGFGALLLILLIVRGINHMLDQAREAGRAEVQAQWEAEKAGRALASAELTKALSEALTGLDGTLQNVVRSATVQGQTIRIRVEKEMRDDPRYSDPQCSLSDSVREAINAARRLSGDPASASVNIRSLSLRSDAGGRFVVDTGDGGR